jgi:hypothetical protein
MSSPLRQRSASEAADPRLAGADARRAVDAALRRFTRRARVEPLLVRHVLAASIRAALLRAFPDETLLRAPVLLGLVPGPRAAVPIGGLDVRVAVGDGPGLVPREVTPFVRGVDGLVAGDAVAIGAPDHLVAAARVLGVPPEVGVDAVRAVVRELVRAQGHAGVAAARYVDDAGWQVFHFAEVVVRVHDPATQIGLAEARAWDASCEPGDWLGVGASPGDWLTPLLLWMAGGG